MAGAVLSGLASASQSVWGSRRSCIRAAWLQHDSHCRAVAAACMLVLQRLCQTACMQGLPGKPKPATRHQAASDAMAEGKSLAGEPKCHS